jgi:HD-like signal output (HDOD) protein
VILRKFVDLLRQLFQTSAPENETTAAIAQRLQRQVLHLVDNMPTLPDVAARALALANDPNSRFADLATIIEGDAAIATRLLRIANSSMFAGGSAAVKLPQAVVRLGMRRCQNLILAVSTQSLFQKIAGPAQAQCAVLWQHSYVTACLCRQINRAYRVGFDGEEFSAGLLHDLGRILLAIADPDAFSAAGAMDFREHDDVLQRECAAIGIDHAALGGWYGEHSQLPDALIQTMRYHHTPATAASAQILVALVAAADDMANHLQRREDVADYNPMESVGLQLLWARWSPAKKMRLIGEIAGLMEESVQAAANEQQAA